MYIKILISVIFFCINGIMTRLFQLKLGKQSTSIRIYQAGFCGVASAAYFITCDSYVLTLPTLLCAFAFGILFALCSFLGAKCYECGPMSLTSIMMNLSLSIPLIYSFFVWNETISPLQSIGLAMLVLTFVLSAKSSGNDSKSISLVWFIMALIGYIANGSTAVIQKQHQFIVGEEAAGIFLAIAYCVSMIFFIVLFAVENKGLAFKPKEHFSNLTLLLPVILLSGLGSFIGNKLLSELSTKVAAPILYPCINGGLALLTGIVSFAAFKEKTTKLKALSMITGLCAIILLAI